MQKGGDPGRKAQAKKVTPPVPITTYRWEDIRRSRRKGGYPWTHLDKPVLYEDIESKMETEVKKKVKKVRKVKKVADPKPTETEKPVEVAEQDVLVIPLRDISEIDVLKGEKQDEGDATQEVNKMEVETLEESLEKSKLLKDEPVEVIETKLEVVQDKAVEEIDSKSLERIKKRWDEPVEEAKMKVLEEAKKEESDTKSFLERKRKPARRWDEPVDEAELKLLEESRKEEEMDSKSLERKQKPAKRWDEPVDEVDLKLLEESKIVEQVDDKLLERKKKPTKRWDEPVDEAELKLLEETKIVAETDSKALEIIKKPLRRWDEPVDEAELKLLDEARKAEEVDSKSLERKKKPTRRWDEPVDEAELKLLDEAKKAEEVDSKSLERKKKPTRRWDEPVDEAELKVLDEAKKVVEVDSKSLERKNKPMRRWDEPVDEAELKLLNEATKVEEVDSKSLERKKKSTRRWDEPVDEAELKLLDAAQKVEEIDSKSLERKKKPMRRWDEPVNEAELSLLDEATKVVEVDDKSLERKKKPTRRWDEPVDETEFKVLEETKNIEIDNKSLERKKKPARRWDEPVDKAELKLLEETKKVEEIDSKSLERKKKIARRWDDPVEEEIIDKPAVDVIVPKDVTSTDTTEEPKKEAVLKPRMRRWDEPVEDLELQKIDTKQIEKKTEQIDKPRMRKWDEPVEESELFILDDKQVEPESSNTEKRRSRKWDEPADASTELNKEIEIAEVEPQKPRMRRWDEPVEGYELLKDESENISEPMETNQGEEEINYELIMQSPVTDEDILAAGNRICEKVLSEKKAILGEPTPPKLKRQESIIDKLKDKTKIFKKHKKSDPSDLIKAVEADMTHRVDTDTNKMREKVEECDKENIDSPAKLQRESSKKTALKKSESKKSVVSEKSVGKESIIDKIKDKTKNLLKSKKTTGSKPDLSNLDISQTADIPTVSSESEYIIIKLKDDSQPAQEEKMEIDETIISDNTKDHPTESKISDEDILAAGNRIKEEVLNQKKTALKKSESKKSVVSEKSVGKESIIDKIKDKTKNLLKSKKTTGSKPDLSNLDISQTADIPTVSSESEYIIIKLKDDSQPAQEEKMEIDETIISDNTKDEPIESIISDEDILAAGNRIKEEVLNQKKTALKKSESKKSVVSEKSVGKESIIDKIKDKTKNLLKSKKTTGSKPDLSNLDTSQTTEIPTVSSELEHIIIKLKDDSKPAQEEKMEIDETIISDNTKDHPTESKISDEDILAAGNRIKEEVLNRKKTALGEKTGGQKQQKEGFVEKIKDKTMHLIKPKKSTTTKPDSIEIDSMQHKPDQKESEPIYTLIKLKDDPKLEETECSVETDKAEITESQVTEKKLESSVTDEDIIAAGNKVSEKLLTEKKNILGETLEEKEKHKEGFVDKIKDRTIHLIKSKKSTTTSPDVQELIKSEIQPTETTKNIEVLKSEIIDQPLTEKSLQSPISDDDIIAAGNKICQEVLGEKKAILGETPEEKPKEGLVDKIKDKTLHLMKSKKSSSSKPDLKELDTTKAKESKSVVKESEPDITIIKLKDNTSAEKAESMNIDNSDAIEQPLSKNKDNEKSLISDEDIIAAGNRICQEVLGEKKAILGETPEEKTNEGLVDKIKDKTLHLIKPKKSTSSKPDLKEIDVTKTSNTESAGKVIAETIISPKDVKVEMSGEETKSDIKPVEENVKSIISDEDILAAGNRICQEVLSEKKSIIGEKVDEKPQKEGFVEKIKDKTMHLIKHKMSSSSQPDLKKLDSPKTEEPKEEVKNKAKEESILVSKTNVDANPQSHISDDDILAAANKICEEVLSEKKAIMGKGKDEERKEESFIGKIIERTKSFKKRDKTPDKQSRKVKVETPTPKEEKEPEDIIIRLRHDSDKDEDGKVEGMKDEKVSFVEREPIIYPSIEEDILIESIPPKDSTEIKSINNPMIDETKNDENIVNKIQEKSILGFKKAEKSSKTAKTKPDVKKKVAPKKNTEPDVIIIKLKHDSDESIPDDEYLEMIQNNVQTVSDVENLKDKEKEKDLKETKVEPEKTEEKALEQDNEEISTSDDISQYLDKDEQQKVIVTEKPLKDDAEDVEVAGKSEDEIKKKRKLSVESKVSLKSLDVMKKLRETKEKIKMPTFTMPKFQLKKKPELKKIVKTKKEKTKIVSVKRKEHSPKEVQKTIKTETKKAKQDSPVYIHIPLKPPTVPFKSEDLKLQMDLDEDEKKTENTEGTVDDIPPVVLTKDVVIIPLDVTKHIEGNISVLEEKVKIIDLTQEEKSEPPPVPEKPKKRRKKPTPIVDEEDGLKSIPPETEPLPDVKEELELKSSLKSEEHASPVLKKKVSFKKRPSSRVSEESRIYESFDIPKDHSPNPEAEEEASASKEEPTIVEKTDRRLKSIQSVSVDDEKSYLEKVLIKSTSLEDDYQKWSKSTDHEYEPINPPEPELSQPSTQATGDQQHAQVDASTGELRYKPESAVSSTTSLDRKCLRVPMDDEVVVPEDGQKEDEAMAGKNLGDGSAQDLHRYTPTTVGSRTESRTDGEFNTSQYNSSILEDLPLHKESRKRATLAKAEAYGSDIQKSIRNQAGKLKTKLKGMKRPTFNMPSRPKFERPKFQKPKFERPKFERPKISLPKMPDRPKINFPSFTFPRRSTSTKSSGQEVPTSSESNAGGSKRMAFNFRNTYPRILDKFKRSKGPPDVSKKVRKPTPPPEFATVPRAASRKKGPVGSKWVHRFTDIKFADDESKKSRSREFDSSQGSPYIESLSSKDREDSVERRMAADARYNAALVVDDEYERENREIHEVVIYESELPKRWSHGNFHAVKTQKEEGGERSHSVDQINVQEMPSAEVQRYQTESMPSVGTNQEERSSGSSSERHRRGVLEEIDDDEFFLRQKGISQDNIEVGAYLSSEIREAFRNPVNSLTQMNRDNRYEGHEYDLDISDHSLGVPPEPTKRKLIKKPKRIKKTPHVSQEEISYDQDSVLTEPEEYPKSYSSYASSLPPSRPKRGKKGLKEDIGVIPYQETISVDEQFQPIRVNVDNEELRRHMEEIENQQDEEYRVEHLSRYYENEIMKDIQQPEIRISDENLKDFNSNYDDYQHEVGYLSDDQAEFEQSPIAPKRKNKSLRSLNSEVDSIFDEINPKREMFGDIPVHEIVAYRAEQEIMPGERPVAPKRSRTRSPRSRTVSIGDEDRTSRGAESLASDGQIPCEEQICAQDVRDSMGYAVIDKNKQREPPLPPSRPAIPKRRKSTKSNSSRKSGETKFFTVPRPLNDTSPPVRPVRNYSTLNPSRPPRRSTQNLADEEKENIDISQYIEITDEEPSNRRLQSGEVIQKMRDRPLPAPPRPPRKTRGYGKDALSDITHETNIISTRSLDKTEISPTSKDEVLDEIEVSTQTDPLLDDFETCEEATAEISEKISAPRRKRSTSKSSSRFGSKSSISRGRKTPERSKTPVEVLGTEEVCVRSRPQTPQTPIDFENEETITHASMIVQPVDNVQILPNSYVSQRFGTEGPDLFPSPDKIKEMISEIIAHAEKEQSEMDKDDDEEECSEVPESFKSLKDPPHETIIETKLTDEEESKIPDDFEKLEDTSENVNASLETEEKLKAPARVKKLPTKKVVEDDYAEISDFCPIETPVRVKRKTDKKAEEGETTEIPIDFHELKDPPEIAQVIQSPSVLQQQSSSPQIIERIIERQVPVSVIPGPETEVDLLKTQRLQVGDLDVERLNVSQLQAQKIVVTDIEGGHLQVNEIDSKSGNLIVAGIEFPQNLIQDLLEKIQAAAAAQTPQQPPIRQVVNKQTSTDSPSIQEDIVLKIPENKESKTSTSQMDKEMKEKEREVVTRQTSTDHPSIDEEIISKPLTTHKAEEIEKTKQKFVEELVLVEEETALVETINKPEAAQNLIEEKLTTRAETELKQEIEITNLSKDTTVEELQRETCDIKSDEPQPFEPNVDQNKVIETIDTQSEIEEAQKVENIPGIGVADVADEETKLDISGQKKTSPSHQIDEYDLEDNPLDESSSPLASDEAESMVENVSEEFFLKKNLVEKLVDDVISVAKEYVESTLVLDESVTMPQTFPMEAAASDITVPESAVLEDIPVPPVRLSRLNEVKFQHDSSKSSGESEELPQLIHIHHMEFVRSPELEVDPEEVPPQLPPKQRKPPPPKQKSSESEPAPERPQLPVYHSIPYASPFYPEYIPSPPTFYSLRARQQQEASEDDMPVPPRRRRHHRAVSRSSSEDHHLSHPRTRHGTTSPEPSIPQLGGQLARACVNSMDRSLKRLISHIVTNFTGNVDGKQDLHIVLIVLLVLIAGLILLGFGGDKTVHLHHWEYFNPPRDL